MTRRLGRESVISERSQEDELGSEEDSSKDDPELLELADEAVNIKVFQTISMAIFNEHRCNYN